MKKVSIKDLAKALGVSNTLISLVLNNKGDIYGISPETQKRVMEKARELNYHPNMVARGLRTGRSNILGLIVADISNTFYSRISRAIEDQARKNGFHLMLCSSDEDALREKDLIRLLKDQQRCDGIILSTTQSDPDLFNRLKKEKYPFVLIDRYIPKLECPYVLVDNRKGAFDMTNSLIRAGYRNIGLLTISPSHLSSIRDRVEGYRDAFGKAGLQYKSSLVKEVPYDNLKPGTRKAVVELLEGKDKADALFVLNNNLAMATLETLREMGLRIPEDVALATFDDIDAFRFSNPPVSAVAQPMEELGKRSVDLLLSMIGDPKMKKPKKVLLQAKPTLRASTASR